MVDNLPKIVWYSMHHSIYTEAWLLQSKRLAGKELSNPFIADDLLKIIWLSMYHGLTNLNIGYYEDICSHDLKNKDILFLKTEVSRHLLKAQSEAKDHPLKHMDRRGIFNSGCSGHMTGNRAHLEDYQELSKVGSVTFGGSKGSISVKVKRIFKSPTTGAVNFLEEHVGKSAMAAKSIIGLWYYLELERILQAKLGHEKGHASCHLLIGCKLVVSNDVVVNLLSIINKTDCNCQTLADGTQQLNATIDSIEYTITEESLGGNYSISNASGLTCCKMKRFLLQDYNILGMVTDRTFYNLKRREREEIEDEEDAEGQDQDIPSQTDQGNKFATPEKSKDSGEAQAEQISPSTLEASQILTNVASEVFQGSQAHPGSKIYRRKPKSTTTSTKHKLIIGRTNPSAELNTGEQKVVKRIGGIISQMTEEDLQAKFKHAKKSREQEQPG
ncbi:hypothetical protein Tco_0448444 [Tanacetum coccineum]